MVADTQEYIIKVSLMEVVSRGTYSQTVLILRALYGEIISVTAVVFFLLLERHLSSCGPTKHKSTSQPLDSCLDQKSL